ncbi:MAG: Rpn family recombination-promoting nuclease/putative transposase [Massilia sp.]
MSGAHDLEYKQLFGHPELVRDLLAGFTPFACFAGLPPEAFERVNASFVSEATVERRGDMLWRVRLDAECVYVFLLLEFQSRSDHWMALRMQVYVGLLYQDLVKRHQVRVRDKLPTVLPLVFYNGSKAWRAHTDLGALMTPSPDGLAPFQPVQRYVLIDQHTFDPVVLASQHNLLANLFQIELSATSAVLHKALTLFSAWLSGQAASPLRDTLARWVERRYDVQKLQQKSGHLEPPEEIDMGERFFRTKSIAEIFRDEARDEGRKEGLEAGQLLAMRSVVKGQLHKRFGRLPSEHVARIDAAGLDQLNLWADRLMDGRSIAEVLEERGAGTGTP